MGRKGTRNEEDVQRVLRWRYDESNRIGRRIRSGIHMRNISSNRQSYPKHRYEEDAIYLEREGYATSMETTNAAGETETRAAKWKQQPVMTIVITFAPGLRKMRAELIRRMDAWKEFARIQETAPFPINCSDRDVLVALTQHGIPQSTTASPDWGTVRPDWRRARLCSTSIV